MIRVNILSTKNPNYSLIFTPIFVNKKILESMGVNIEFFDSISNELFNADCVIINNRIYRKNPNKTRDSDMFNLLEKLNKKVGLSLNPGTKIDVILKFLDQIDLVLIMSVNPGFGGQKFMPEVLTKVKDLTAINEDKGMKFDIEIDGGINFENSKAAIKAGANILVSGTTIFKDNNGDIKKNIELLRSK